MLRCVRPVLSTHRGKVLRGSGQETEKKNRENEWPVHRRVREMATLLGCEIARQNGQMVERVVNYQQRHSNKSRYSMRAWQWGEAIDYSLMSRLADTRRDMIAGYRREKSIAGHRRRPYAY